MIEADLVKQKTDIVGLISRYVKLSNGGKEYKGRCPFHPDQAPSMVVSRDKGLWHCYGCGAGGDAISFLMKIEGISFQQAISILAQEAGIESDQDDDQSYSIMREVAEYYSELLRSHHASSGAKKYLANLGYDQSVLSHFMIGFAPDLWDTVKKEFSKYGDDTLLSLGLLTKSKGQTYDRFRNRIIFPIRDQHGRVIAFGGRSLNGEPKYLNSPNTSIFDKGKTIYGIYEALESITGTAVLVEGYTDVISMHITGTKNVVASMGTALTQDQASKIVRLVNKVIVAYDGDSAGDVAAIRGLKIIRDSGAEVEIAMFPKGQDPDSFVRSGEDFQDVKTVPFHKFYLQQVAKEHNVKTITGKESFIKEIKSFCDGLNSVTLQHEIVEEAASMARVSPSIILRGINSSVKQAVSQLPDRSSDLLTPEQTLMMLILRNDITVSSVAHSISAFSEQNQRIIEAVRDGKTHELGPDDISVISHYSLLPVLVADPERAYKDALSKMTKIPNVWSRINEINETMKNCPADAWKNLVREKVVLMSFARKAHV